MEYKNERVKLQDIMTRKYKDVAIHSHELLVSRPSMTGLSNTKKNVLYICV